MLGHKGSMCREKCRTVAIDSDPTGTPLSHVLDTSNGATMHGPDGDWRLRGAYREIQENDLWLCAQAVAHGMVLVANDRMTQIRTVATGMTTPSRLHFEKCTT
jgi:hypothetical protein